MSQDPSIGLPAGEAAPPWPQSRYLLLRGADGTQRITTAQAPQVLLHIVPALTVSAKTRADFPRQSVFLDGVFHGPPFFDNVARHYALDHHVGCVRAFTLATCEQALVMLMQGLPLHEGRWHLYVNDPDVDALLAAWLLLNFNILLADERRLLRAVTPLVRLEGAIDAHGLAAKDLTGFPEELLATTSRQLDLIVARERRRKREGTWHRSDWIQHALETFDELDGLFFPLELRDGLQGIIELERLPLTPQRIAVLCRSSLGAYAVESQLRRRYGASLGLLVLFAPEQRVTLRLCDPFMPGDLQGLYATLNRRDPAVAEDAMENFWGGAAEIGGSPRRTGTQLSLEAIAQAVREHFGASTEAKGWPRSLRGLLTRWRRRLRDDGDP